MTPTRSSRTSRCCRRSTSSSAAGRRSTATSSSPGVCVSAIALSYLNTSQFLQKGRWEVERAREHNGQRVAQLPSHVRDVDALVPGLVALEPAQRLFELARRSDPVAAPGLVPRDGDVDEALVEVPLRLGSGAPG